MRADDPFGSKYEITYDKHSLMIVSASDPFVNKTRVLLDPQNVPSNFEGVESPYRALQATAIVDPNENGVAIEYDLFGRVVALAHVGKEGRSEGDRLSEPSVTFAYDLRVLPARVVARARVFHGRTNTRWQERHSHSDGFGREIMTKVQAELGLARVRGADGKFVEQ
ncbi:MAG: hypothetical protein IPN77_32335 [Sandaracinaceae bacterium]|nr:hypothetical protein [Sandaracinaceae bacterium]